MYEFNMADNNAESSVRKILDHSEFVYKNNKYKIIQNEKPSGETKTDFYIVAVNLKNNIKKTFTISYKKSTFTFVENKIQKDRAKIIYGSNWLKILKSQIMQKNSIKTNEYWKKSNPELSLEESFKKLPMINFKRKKIILGWRYEIEQLDVSGNRTLSGKIDEDIASKVFWDEGCKDNRRNAMVDGNIIPDSGIPNYILIRDPKKIQSADDVFSHMEDIQEYAKQHKELRADFMSQYYRLNSSNFWVTEGGSRDFIVWIQWNVVDGKLDGRIVFDRPFDKTSGNINKNLMDCLDQMNIENTATSFNIESLRGHLTDTTLSIG